MIYVDAGTVHAVGPDSIIVETQQNCDITYRLYDYGRPRELHLDRGMAAIRGKDARGTGCSRRPSEGRELLVASPCFIVEKYKIESPVTLRAAPGRSSVQVLVCLDGGAVVECAGSQPLPLMRGEAVVIPASSPAVTLRPQWSAEILRMRLPARNRGGAAHNFAYWQAAIQACADCEERSWRRTRKPEFYPIILAGGRGTRFWPLSRKTSQSNCCRSTPAQSMIQETVARLLPAAPGGKVLDHHQRRSPAEHRAPAQAAAPQADCCRTGGAQHRSGHRAGGVHPAIAGIRRRCLDFFPPTR